MTASPPRGRSAAELLAALPTVLRAARLERGLSLRQAAAQLGVSYQAYYRWENDQESPRLEAIIQLLRWLGVNDHVAVGLEALPVLLHRVRQQRQLSWEQAAAQLGVHGSLLARWERGEVTPDLAHTIALLRWWDGALNARVGMNGWPAYQDTRVLVQTLPERLAAQRARLAVTIRQAAVQIGLPADTLRLLEDATTRPRLDSAILVAEWLDPRPDAELAVLRALPRLAQRARLRLGLTQAQVAEALGVSQPTVSSLERRRSLPDTTTAVALLGWLAELKEPAP